MNIVSTVSTEPSNRELWVCQLGTVPYALAVAIQTEIRERRQAGELPDTLLLLEHPPVYTRGRRSGSEDLRLNDESARSKDIEVVATDRGGKLTYHSPGQLVGYPIMKIDDVHSYLRTMEDAIITTLSEVGVDGRSRHDEGIDYTGVWVQDRKIASIGVHVSRGVTTHGFAVNVENDLEPFSWVIACGLPDVTMTSLARERPPAGAGAYASEGEGEGEDARLLPCMRRRMAFQFARAHGRRQRLVSPRRLGIDATNTPGRAPTGPQHIESMSGAGASLETVPA